MQYLGGKHYSAKPIASILTEALRANGGGAFVSLFCGAVNVESKVRGYDRIILNDKHPYLIALLKGVQNGCELPEEVSEEEYYRIKADKDKDPVLSGFVGFAFSYGGRWMKGYARDPKEGRNYASVGKKGLLRKMKPLHDAEILCMDYKNVPIPDKSVIYADPPYMNKTGYAYTINSGEFWNYMRDLSKRGHKVFISEESAPPDFKCIWEKEAIRTIKLGGRTKATEKLFVYNGDYL